MKKIKDLIRNNKGKIFLFALATLAVFLFVKGTMVSEEYHEKLKNKVSVVSTVTDIEEKTRTEEISFDTGDGVEFHEYEETYYKITTTYEYNNQKYNYSFNSDSLYIDDTSGESYSIGKELLLQIDSTAPEYVLDGNPGNAYRIASYVFAGLLLVILIYYIIYKISPRKMGDAVFVYPWFLGAIITCIFGIKMIITNKTGILGYLLTFLLTPIYIGVWFIFSRISKEN